MPAALHAVPDPIDTLAERDAPLVPGRPVQVAEPVVAEGDGFGGQDIAVRRAGTGREFGDGSGDVRHGPVPES